MSDSYASRVLVGASRRACTAESARRSYASTRPVASLVVVSRRTRDRAVAAAQGLASLHTLVIRRDSFNSFATCNGHVDHDVIAQQYDDVQLTARRRVPRAESVVHGDALAALVVVLVASTN